MTAPDTPKPTPIVQIGKLKLTGPMAFVAIIATLFVAMGPSPKL